MPDLKPSSLLVIFLAQACEQILIKMHSIKSRLSQDRKTRCLQARPCSFQPGHFTGWGSERVNGAIVVIVAAEKNFGEFVEKMTGYSEQQD